jgi:hypothetical protein
VGPFGSGGADGSGCTPGAQDLPDGVWYGIVTAVTGEAVEFDLACRYSEERADGPGDPSFRYANDSTRLRRLPVGDTATFFLFDESYQPGPRLAIDGRDADAATALLRARSESGRPGGLSGWLKVEGGVATEFMETLPE